MIKYQMENWTKLLLIFLASFAAIFTLNGLLTMNETHGFFYVTPVNILIRLFTAFLITVNFAGTMKIPIPVIPTIVILVLGTIAIALILMIGCQNKDHLVRRHTEVAIIIM